MRLSPDTRPEPLATPEAGAADKARRIKPLTALVATMKAAADAK